MSMESTRRNSNRINGGGHDAGLGMGVTSMGGRLGGSKKDRWRAQAELQRNFGRGGATRSTTITQMSFGFLDGTKDLPFFPV